MKQPKVINLHALERIIAVVPYPTDGAVGVVSIVCVYIFDDETTRMRVEYLKLDDLTPALRELFDIGALVCQQMRAAVPVRKTR